MLVGLLAVSSITGASAHGWMTHPLAELPNAVGYDIEKINSPTAAIVSAWYTHGTTCSSGGNPSTCPGEADIVASCGTLRYSNDDWTCGKTGKDNVWNKSRGYPPQWCDGRRYLGSRSQITWEAGKTAEIGWSIFANHEGIVGYRLCPREQVGQDSGNDGATEKCFQAHHLEFATDQTCVQCPTSDGNATSDRKCFDATDHTGKNGNVYRETIAKQCTGAAQGPDFCNGKIDYPCTNQGVANFSLVDQVKVPNLPEGVYVLSFRWDCKRTPQVWTNCAEIKIAATNEAQQNGRSSLSV